MKARQGVYKFQILSLRVTFEIKSTAGLETSSIITKYFMKCLSLVLQKAVYLVTKTTDMISTINHNLRATI